MWMITTVCQSFGALSKPKATWHTRVSQRTHSQFNALSISGRISSQPTAFPAFSVLTVWKTSGAAVLFPHKCASCRVWCPVVRKWLGSKDLGNSSSMCQGCPLRCGVRQHFGLWWIYQYENFCLEDAGWFARTLGWLASNWNPVNAWNSPTFVFWTFFTVRTADFRAWTCRECKEESDLFWSHTLYATFFARIACFNSWFHHGFTFCHYPPHRGVSVRIPKQQMKPRPPLGRPLCILGSPGARTIRCLQRPSLHPFHYGLPLYSVRPSGAARFCMSGWIFKT